MNGVKVLFALLDVEFIYFVYELTKQDDQSALRYVNKTFSYTQENEK